MEIKKIVKLIAILFAKNLRNKYYADVLLNSLEAGKKIIKYFFGEYILNLS